VAFLDPVLGGDPRLRFPSFPSALPLLLVVSVGSFSPLLLNLLFIFGDEANFALALCLC